MTVLVSRMDLGGAMAWAGVCSFWEAYINTGWDGEGQGVGVCNGLSRK